MFRFHHISSIGRKTSKMLPIHLILAVALGPSALPAYADESGPAPNPPNPPSEPSR